MSSVILDAILYLVKYLWKKMKGALLLCILLIIEVFVLSSYYDTKISEARYQNEIKVLEHNVDNIDNTGQIQLVLANKGNVSRIVPNFRLVCDKETYGVEPMLGEPYNKDLDYFMLTGIPIDTAVTLMYAIEDYEQYKEEIWNSEKIVLTSVSEEVLIEIK